jgi:hypothetical protein
MRDASAVQSHLGVEKVLPIEHCGSVLASCQPRRSPQSAGNLSTDGQFRSKQVQVRANLMLQQFTEAEAGDSAQALCQFCREQPSSGEPLRWIALASAVLP